MSYASEVVADSPLAYYRLGESGGTTLVDSSGNGRDGSYAGAYTLGAAPLLTGDPNTAADFSGGYATVPDAAWMQPANMSAECWFRADVASGSTPRVLMSRSNWQGTNNSPSRSWHMLVANNTLACQVVTPTGNAEPSGGVVTAGVVHHAVMTYDGTTLRAYLDGIEVISQAIGGNLNPAVGAPLGIGVDSVRKYERFDGVIDEAAYYNHALSAARVAAHRAAGTPSPATGLSAALGAETTLTADLGARAPLSASLDASASVVAGLAVVGRVPLDGTLVAESGIVPTLTVRGNALLSTRLVTSASLAASLRSVAIVDTSTEYANDGYNYDGTAAVYFEPPIAETPAHIRRVKVMQVHQSMSAPVLVNGRPT